MSAVKRHAMAVATAAMASLARGGRCTTATSMQMWAPRRAAMLPPMNTSQTIEYRTTSSVQEKE
jgi:hypothetical protein